LTLEALLLLLLLGDLELAEVVEVEDGLVLGGHVLLQDVGTLAELLQFIKRASQVKRVCDFARELKEELLKGLFRVGEVAFFYPVGEVLEGQRG